MATATHFSQTFALFFIDLNGFKLLNDTYGHDAGDAVLKNVTSNLSKTIRESDLLARIGGDEFVVVMYPSSNRNEVMKLGSRLQSAINLPVEWNSVSLAISASIGVALFPEDATSLENLIRCADEAMYQSKKGGKKELIFYGKH